MGKAVASLLIAADLASVEEHQAFFLARGDLFLQVLSRCCGCWQNKTVGGRRREAHRDMGCFGARCSTSSLLTQVRRPYLNS